MGRKSRAKQARADKPQTVAATQSWSRNEWLGIGTLIGLPPPVFGQIAGHSFLHYDDDQFIYENSDVMAGLSAGSIAAAFTSAKIGGDPPTWLSHGLDGELGG